MLERPNIADRDFLAEMRAIWSPKSPLEAAQSSLRDAIRHLEVEAQNASTLDCFRLSLIKIELDNQLRALAAIGEDDVVIA